VAQSLSMFMAWVASNRAGYSCKSPVTDTDAPPPFWMLYRTDGKTPVAFIVFWYDNLLIIAADRFVADSLRGSVERTSNTFGMRWKTNSQGVKFECSVNKVEYLGIVLQKQEGHVTWRHAEPARWLALLESTTRTWRTASALLGVIVWDWVVGGYPRSSMTPYLDIARYVGKVTNDHDEHEPEEWDAPASLSDNSWSLLLGAVQKIVTQDEQVRHLPRRPEGVLPIVFVASDAMKARGAVVFMEPDGGENGFALVQYDESLSINIKETQTAITAIAMAALSFPGSEIRIAVDNTAAWVAIDTGIYVTDAETQLELDELQLLLQLTGCTCQVTQVPGAHMAADERSRNLVTVRDKVLLCCQALAEVRDLKWYEKLSQRAVRPREET